MRRLDLSLDQALVLAKKGKHVFGRLESVIVRRRFSRFEADVDQSLRWPHGKRQDL